VAARQPAAPRANSNDENFTTDYTDYADSPEKIRAIRVIRGGSSSVVCLPRCGLRVSAFARVARFAWGSAPRRLSGSVVVLPRLSRSPSAFCAFFGGYCFLVACLFPTLAWAQIDIAARQSPVSVFSGVARRLGLTLHNPGRELFSADLHARLYQATSATAVPLDLRPWKRVEVLPGQTILESAALDFPLVRAETPFLVQWLEASDKVVGLTELKVYPPDLLKDLRPLAGGEALGSFDPLNQLKPLLKAASVEFVDLEETGLQHFVGKLAIIGPFGSKAKMRSDLGHDIKALARRGVGVVWLQPPPEPRDRLVPSFYVVPEGKGTVVVVQAGVVENLAESPKAQLNLVECSRLAVRPERFQLPQTSGEPQRRE
jgi:hypothetical protein